MTPVTDAQEWRDAMLPFLRELLLKGEKDVLTALERRLLTRLECLMVEETQEILSQRERAWRRRQLHGD